MASGFRFNWRGRRIPRVIAAASKVGIDQTMAAAVPLAKQETPGITGTAQGSIQFREAVIQGRRVVGRWGSFDVNYFIWLEIGARGRPGLFMLRRAADREYPNLGSRIREALRV